MDGNYRHFWVCSTCDHHYCDGCDKYGQNEIGVIICRKCKVPTRSKKNKKQPPHPILCFGVACTCLDENCGECASYACAYEDTDHFAHDGCPSCYIAARECPLRDPRHNWAIKCARSIGTACSCGVYRMCKLSIRIIEKSKCQKA